MKIVNIHAPGKFQLVALPAPDIGADDALIRVKACGICGSDIAYIDAGGAGFGKNRAPALGHEAAGEIVALGANVAGFALGERVAINPIDPVLRNAIGNGAPEGAFGNVVAVRNAAQQRPSVEITGVSQLRNRRACRADGSRSPHGESLGRGAWR